MSSKDGAALARGRAALKYALMGLGGASIEWYDFLLYGTAAALVFPTEFFPVTLSPFVAVVFMSATCVMSLVCASMLKETHDTHPVEQPEPTVA
jgi:hypothetical protein